MPFKLIKGEFRIIGAAPDGDSIRFYPTAERAFERAGVNARVNRAGGAQLRLDGIDTLETHYAPQVGGTGVLHQPLAIGHAAADHLLKQFGFTKVERNTDETVTHAEPESTPGYIFTRFADQYGRCVAFAFPGECDQDDLDTVFVNANMLSASGNHHVLSAGLGYPTYYSKLFPDLRQAFTDAVTTARAGGKGLWPEDVTNVGFIVDGLATLTDDVVIMPKLFRRLVDYLALNDGDPSLDGLSDYLAAREDRLLIVSRGHVTGFDNTVEISGQNVRLMYPPEDLVFLEKKPTS